MTDPALEWLRSGGLEEARERCEALVCWRCGGDGVEVYADMSEYRCHVCHGLGAPNRNYDTDTIQKAAADLPAALSLLERVGEALAEMDVSEPVNGWSPDQWSLICALRDAHREE